MFISLQWMLSPLNEVLLKIEGIIPEKSSMAHFSEPRQKPFFSILNLLAQIYIYELSMHNGI